MQEHKISPHLGMSLHFLARLANDQISPFHFLRKKQQKKPKNDQSQIFRVGKKKEKKIKHRLLNA